MLFFLLLFMGGVFLVLLFLLSLCVYHPQDQEAGGKKEGLDWWCCGFGSSKSGVEYGIG